MVDFSKSPSGKIPDLAGCIIDDAQLLLLDVIGQGAWGKVYRAQDITNPGDFYAVKCISLRHMSNAQKASVEQEIDLQNICASTSPFVLQLHSVIEDRKRGLMFIVTDLCDGGDLLENIISKKFIGRDERIKHVYVQILDAVEACHSAGIYHRDLKPENILLHGDKAILADFGFATTRKVTSDFGLGSAPFMSPECRGGINAQLRRFSSEKADVWALGVILVSLVTTCLPWPKACNTDHHFMHYLLNDPDHLYHTYEISRGANEIFKSVFALDPRMRPSIAELRKRVLDIKTFGPGCHPRADAERYVSDGSEFDTDSETLSSSSASGFEPATLHVVNGTNTSKDAAVVADLTSDFVQNIVLPSEQPIPATNPSSNLGPFMDDLDDIVPVPVHGASLAETDITDASLESDADSEGPITPETHAVDEAATAELDELADIAEIDLGDPEALAEVGTPNLNITEADATEVRNQPKITLRSTARMMGLSMRYRKLDQASTPRLILFLLDS